jgi:transcriptional regulator with XRE-family HTH domain
VTEKKLGSSKTLHHRETPDFIAVNKRLAHIVRQRRQELKWTIEQASEKMQVDPSQLKRIEAASSNPTLALLVTLANALEIKLSQLLADDSK